MKHLACLFALLLPALALAADPPKPTVVAKDLSAPMAVHVTSDGRTFVTSFKGVMEVKDGKGLVIAEITDGIGLASFQQSLFVSTNAAVHRIDLRSGKSEEWAGVKDLPGEPSRLHGITVNELGWVYVAEIGNKKSNALYRIGVKAARPGTPPARGEIKKVADLPAGACASLTCDGMSHVLVAEQRLVGGAVWRVNVTDGKAEEVKGRVEGGTAGCVDPHGRVFTISPLGIWGIPRPGVAPVVMLDKQGVWAVAYHPVTRQLLYTDNDTLYSIPAVIPGWEVDESPLPVEAVPALADVTWTGWDDGSSSGKSNPFRPLVLTHANDASGRTFVATQHGVIHIVEKGAKASKVFLDLQSKVLYKDNENEQGLLGLAFHPDYKKTGEFYAFYTDKAKKLENVLSRFKVSKDDPNKADPASEEELLRVSHKYWNHDGGTLAFGPDGFLYVVLGDGGSGGDPDDHGQKNDVLLGKILRLDVNHKGDTTPYAIPKDNPFVGKKEYRPEIYAMGVRNPWRMSFDRKTGQGWFGEVGQNLWEEINLLEKGANYGWRRRESLHPFGADGSGPKAEFTDPIWEYSHEVGKSITGGHVYRGKAVPALDGHYLYADYVSTKVWALKYDEKGKRVTANRPVAAPKLAWMTFGEDEAGEVYLMTYAANGKGIYTFKPGK